MYGQRETILWQLFCDQQLILNIFKSSGTLVSQFSQYTLVPAILLTIEHLLSFQIVNTKFQTLYYSSVVKYIALNSTFCLMLFLYGVVTLETYLLLISVIVEAYIASISSAECIVLLL